MSDRGTKAITIPSGPRTGHEAAAIHAVFWRPTPTVGKTLTRIVSGPLKHQISGSRIVARQVECLAENEEGPVSGGPLVPVELLAIHSVVPVNLPVTGVAVTKPVVGNDENEPSVPPTLVATCQ